MNSEARYLSSYNEAMKEDSEGLLKFIAEEREKALKSYPKGTEPKYCPICKEPMYYNSVSYDEGFHIDDCI